MNCGRSRVASSLRSGFVQPAVKAITATKNVNMMIYLLFLISVIDKLLQRYAFFVEEPNTFPLFLPLFHAFLSDCLPTMDCSSGTSTCKRALSFSYLSMTAGICSSALRKLRAAASWRIILFLGYFALARPKRTLCAKNFQNYFCITGFFSIFAA